MSNVAKIVLPLLLVAGAAGGAYYFLNQPDDTLPVGTTPDEPTQPIETPKETNKPTEVVTSEKANNEPVRVEATGPAGNSHADAPQGIRGRVLQPDGLPAAGVPVLIVQNSMNNPLEIFIRNKSGQVSPPLATTVTAQDGSFVLGMRKANQTVDLRVASDNYPELSRSPIKVRHDEWVEAGDLKLEQGLLVQGRVFDITENMPVAGATVFMNLASNSHAVVATPGRERGVSAVTDQGGFFRFENGPRLGLVNLTAEADGYASGQLMNQQLKSDAPNDFRIEVEQGRTITGVVVDDTGKRITGAKMTAVGLSSKTPQTETVYSNDDGEFIFEALREGPYRLTASAKRFAEVENPLVVTDEDVTIVLVSRGSVKLKVLTSNNRSVKTYGLSLKRTYPNNPEGIGNVLDFPDRRITPRNYRGDWAIIDGLPSGSFRFQLTERNHAKSLSPVFTVTEGDGEQVEVIAVLTNGASITGTVIDDSGKPVHNAQVTSDMNAGLAANTGIFEMFRKMMPEKHTTKSTRTDKQGRFRIDRLSFADYMLRVSHDAYCEGTAINIKLQTEGQVLDAGVIQLQKGTIIEGSTTVDGQPAGQVKVVISMPTPKQTPGQSRDPKKAMTQEEMQAAAKQMFSANVLSDSSGRFRLLKRIPPGTYKITAARHSRENPFGALLDMKQSEQELIIAPGQERAVVNFNLSSR